jgi:hypothetical protein
MKKIFIILFILFLSVGLYLKLGSEADKLSIDFSGTSEVKDESSLSKKTFGNHPVGGVNPKSSLSSASKSKLKDHPAYEDVRNYQISDQDLVKSWEGREEILKEFLLNASKQTSSCLQKDLCGQEPDPGSPYFNPSATPEHSFLERQLSLLIQLKENGLLRPEDLPKKDLENMLKISNDSIQSLAFELRISAGIDDASYNQLLDISPSLLPQASASALVQLTNESRNSPSRREDLIRTTAKLINSDDQNQAIEMAKRVKYLGVDKNEIEQLALQACDLLPHNRKLVRNHLSIAAEGAGTVLKFYCR